MTGKSQEQVRHCAVAAELTGESVIGDFGQCGISVGYWIREHAVLSDILHLAH